MKFKLSIVALALATISSGASAFDFGVTAAKAAKQESSWKCSKCVSPSQVLGSVSLEVGMLDSEDDHAANRLRYTEGFAVGVNADTVINNQGYRTEVYADGLGSEQALAKLKTGRLGQWSVEAGYQASNQYDADNAQSRWLANGGNLIEQQGLTTQELALERQKFTLEADFSHNRFGSYVAMSSEDKTGKQRSSMTNGSIDAINIAAPVDHTTQNLRAGINLKGANWFTELSYNGSWFDNNIEKLSIEQPGFADAAQAVDNQAHFVTLQGNYIFDRSYIAGRVASGNMSQDGDFITLTGVADGNLGADAEVDTLDANLKFSSRVMKGLRLNASVDYSDRDNNTELHEYEQVSIDGVTGELVQNTPYDTTRSAYKLSANYQLMAGQRIEVGYDRIETERTNQDREETDDNIFWAQWRATGFDMWDLRVKGSYADKGGSQFLYNDAVNGSEDQLMRKYYLADKKSSKAEVFITHTPIDSVAISAHGYYSLDDYANSSIGLTESNNYGFDLGLSWQVTKDLLLSSDGGYQWLDNQQASSKSQYAGYWAADTNEEFGFVGAGFTYSGLSDSGITIGGDYNFAISFSDSYVDGNDVFGMYESTSHHANLYVNYAISQQIVVGLRYEFEAYEDSDDTQLPVDYYPGTGPTGLTTLGLLDHDYKAHLILATVQYRF
ncbi:MULTISPECIES: MtrB/PioB family decaheme-associated outer membrane protein [unclassified Shewanella]|uniref:MtrB/PioB family decaheme-associated outer membrane protein n=1 Tax=unclassified Shewanella TaxID=196818 RepID=UPI001BC2E25E|nr:MULTISPECIES: MtrB/PioB family decaheme-associated outer membrane protein [unclassified Shewanella]GIU16959.1 membrane protein [Shewanella sp. MBTL60-112-B1]GIU40906.1 membrane protein [Shewanella sp. MBTL60-112-B2]